MLIINTVITGSNADFCLDEKETMDVYIPLMDYISNDQLNRFLPGHQINFKLKKREIASGFADGDLFYVTQGDVIVLCVGVSPEMTAEQVAQTVKSIRSGTKQDDVYFSTNMREVPGADMLLTELLTDDKINEVEWAVLKQTIQKQHSSLPEKDKRKESML